MDRPCKILIKIDDIIYDAEESFGLYLMESPDILVPPQREYEKEEYPETSGVLIFPKTVYQSFDYKLKLLGIGNKQEVNNIINTFYEYLFVSQGDIKTAKEITIYNQYKNISIVGYAKGWDGKETFVNTNIPDCSGIVFELVIQVVKPNICNFKTSSIIPNGIWDNGVTDFDGLLLENSELLTI